MAPSPEDALSRTDFSVDDESCRSEWLSEASGVFSPPFSDNSFKGSDCFADDRDAINDYARYFNNEHLSDVSLHVGDVRYPAHKIVLCKSSEVFDRMLSERWNGQAPASQLTLQEDVSCQNVFPNFLRFLYSNQVLLHAKTALPILILADKYAVSGLQKVCVDYAIECVLPDLSMRNLIHIWFKYSTTAFHKKLADECVKRIAEHFSELISADWEEDWLSLDRDQLLELLFSNDLIVNNEFELWEAVQRWLRSPRHPERQGLPAMPLVNQVAPLIRFPFMSAEELAEVEASETFRVFEKILRPLTHKAYKFISMPLSSRASCSDFNGIQFILRDYKDNRWEKRISFLAMDLNQTLPIRGELSANLSTKASTYPRTHWDWELTLLLSRVSHSGHATSGYIRIPPSELSIELKAIDLDQQRSVEYMLMVTDDREILRTFIGKKTFTKSRTACTVDLDNRMTISELIGVDPTLVHKGRLHVQLMFRPIV